jgi:RimJ/RimL family protein N-acetyltransferase
MLLMKRLDIGSSILRFAVNTVLTVETERLTLRQLRASDVHAYAELCADPDVMKYIGDGGPLSRDDAWRQLAMLIGHWELRGFGTWAVEEKATGSFVGRVGLHHPAGWPEPEIGWMLVRRVWGRGYAHEAANAAVGVAFDSLAWNRAISLIAPDNTRSIAVAERLGERFERELTVRGHQVALYAIDASEWRASPVP